MYQRRTGTPGSAAFSMIEMLVVLSILGVVATVVAAAVSSGILVWDRTSGFDRVRMAAVLAMEELERDLRNAAPHYDLEFTGALTELKFCQLLGGNATQASDDYGFAEVSYRFSMAKSSVQRLERRYPFAAGSRRDERDVFSDVKSMRFSYSRKPDKDGTPDLVWLDAWKAESQRIPHAVRVRMVLGEEGEELEIDRVVFLQITAPVPEKAEDDEE